MNDRYDAGHDDGTATPYDIVGYDEYGRPVYGRTEPRQPSPDRFPAQGAHRQAYDPYGQGTPYDGRGGHAEQGGHVGQGVQGGGHGDGQGQGYGYGYDPYAAGQQQPAAPYDPYGTQGGYGADVQQPVQDPYGTFGTYDGYGGTAAPRQPDGGTAVPQQPYDPYGQRTPDGTRPHEAGQDRGIPPRTGSGGRPAHAAPADGFDGRGGPGGEHGPDGAGGPGPDGRGTHGGAADGHGGAAGDPSAGEPGSPAPDDYRTEQFAFVEEPAGDSEDVIDWLKFTENRTERREEARRRARRRILVLTVVLALVVAGGVGALWYAGKLPGTSSSGSGSGAPVAAGAQKRDVIAVHLHDTKRGSTSTALLVNNTTTRRGTAVLLPNSLALTGDDGSTTTLADSVDKAGPDATRTALDSVLGTEIEGTWRLDTPFLQMLVDLVGGIEVDTDADVPDPDAGKKGAAPLVHRGAKQSLSGKMAVAYATHRGGGESADAQLQRFGQVLNGVLRKLSSEPEAATVTVQTLGQVLDPPLTEKDLGTFLAGLSDLAKGGDFGTALLPVGEGGALGAEAADGIVKDVLGGTAKSPDEDAPVSVRVRNATGVEDRTGKARVTLVNGGFTVVQGGSAGTPAAASEVVHAEPGGREDAVQVAQTLGLPVSAVRQGEVGSNADVAVTLGQDYRPAEQGDSP
ncbi:LCP family protein [Streptomyces sp. SHP 1-2]|uniref:LCP family protein n=1 Tax=Streptomyces sp. SHP 1-2 TaxID=2769489 RepID=UPI002237DE56|nr:LCP family protein [Streptomyces sp. SHP 1-2]MCW5248945.1 LCP family protein [Streptomyces sp. SHP 1-2]